MMYKPDVVVAGLVILNGVRTYIALETGAIVFQAFVWTIVNTDFHFSFLSLRSLLFTHFGDTHEADFYWPSYFRITRKNIKKK